MKTMPENTPSMSVEEVIRGMEVVISTALQTDQDVRVGGGATH